MKIISINCGSTSFKYRYFKLSKKEIHEIFSGDVANIGTKNTTQKIKFKDKTTKQKKSYKNINEAALDSIKKLLQLLKENGLINKSAEIDYFVYKIAHGGNKYYEPVIVTEENIASLEKYNQFAPSHNPNFINITKLFLNKFPEIKNYYYFETILHKDLEPCKRTYALPYEWIEKHEILNYGFHSAAHSYSLIKAQELIKSEKFKMISCHLGGGSSVAAFKDSKSFEVSSGFTPQSGTVMASRPGDFDPYVLVYLLKNKIFSLEELEEMLNNNSGMKGISGLSADVAEIVDASRKGNKRANLALDVFCYSVAKYVLSYIGLLKGIDVIAFSGGIGENSSMLREKISKYLDYFNIRIDQNKNNSNQTLISAKGSKAKIIRVQTDEEHVVLNTIFGLFGHKIN